MEKIFKGKRVTVMGLGLNNGGVGVAKFFCDLGAEVLVTDLKTKKQLRKSLSKLKGLKIKYRLGEHKDEDFINTDLVVKNPAVPSYSPFLKTARINKVKVDSDINIFFNLCKGEIIGVTGTKGKSTVATLVHQLLKTKYKTVLAGNIGVSPLEFLKKINKKTKVVLELSSFELEDLQKSPHVAVITSIYPDHLDRYGSMQKYIAAKKLIYVYQNPDDILILNKDDEVLKELASEAKARTLFFSRSGKNSACFMQDDKLYFDNEKEVICKKSDFGIDGEHNIYNILAAVSVAKILDVKNKNIKKVVSSFEGIENRQELIAVKKGVQYINDTTATMPTAVVQVLRTTRTKFPGSNIILIAGGQDKRLFYQELAREISESIDKMVLLPGTASDILRDELRVINSKVQIIPAFSMEEAVKRAASLSKKGDIVLLSPGGASFNLFKNEFDRGEQFVKFVKKL